MKKRASGSIFLSTDKDTVVYRLVASRTSVNIRRVNGSLVPDVGTISFAVTKQMGDEAPATMAAKDWNMEGVTVGITYLVGDTMPHLYAGEDIEVILDNKGISATLMVNGSVVDTVTVGFVLDGEGGVSIAVSPETVVFKKGTKSTAKVSVELYVGNRMVGYGDAADGDMTCSTLTASGKAISEHLSWNFKIDSSTKRFCYVLSYDGEGEENREIAFTVNYNGETYERRIYVKTLSDGLDSKPPRSDFWESYPVGFPFESGDEDESFTDFVIYEGNWFECRKSHVKTLTNYPGSATDKNEGYWRNVVKYSSLATKLFFATYALIKNLGVEVLDMKDANGNILCLIKDGVIKVNTGEFNNVVFSGVAMKRRTEVTAANFSSIFKLDADTDNQYDIDLKSCGTWLDIRYLPSNIIIYPRSMRALCGNTILLYNNTAYALSISAPATTSYNGGPGAFTSFTIERGQFASLDCKVGVKDGKETAYFVVQKGTINTTLDN
ncbi:hypothetical protein HDR58_07925 [bacterium]|nr:hypothetical protein [bacterium]